MTDNYNALIVVLNHNLRSDDAEPLIFAIQQLKGVVSVKGNVVGIESHIADQRAKQDLGEKLWKVLYPEKR